MGFKPSPAFDEVIGNEFGATISREELDMLEDVKVVVWFAENDEMSDPLYQQLAFSQQGRIIIINSVDPTAFAFSFNTVLSLDYVLDGLVPELSIAVDGDPATVTAKLHYIRSRILCATGNASRRP